MRVNNVRHWRNLAEEARSQAQQMNEIETKRIMLEIADSYERIAELAPIPQPKSRTLH
jgi:hypothetical protein